MAELTPKEIERLHETGRKDFNAGQNKRPDDADDFIDLITQFTSTREREYLLTLAEFLETVPTVSEDVSHEAGETDVGVEVVE